eukprot:Skav222190  [mRNA]  locus=scaffold1745:13243:14237:- [translate_table: standard]
MAREYLEQFPFVEHPLETAQGHPTRSSQWDSSLAATAANFIVAMTLVSNVSKVSVSTMLPRSAIAWGVWHAWLVWRWW